MNALPVCVCDRPIHDQAFLCPRCTGHLERDLGDVRALADEVQTTHLGQSRMGGADIGGSRGATTPLPWDDRPLKAAARLLGVLDAWADLVWQQRGGRAPAQTLGDLSVYLLANLEWLRHREEILRARPELESAICRLRFTVDRRMTMVYVGPCGSMEYAENGDPIYCTPICPADVYARPKATTATCTVCAAEHDVADRREWLRDAVDDQLAYPAQIARSLSSLGMPVPEATIRSWVERKRLVPHGEDARGRKLYRVGDVRELVTAEALRQQQRASKNTRRTA